MCWFNLALFCTVSVDADGLSRLADGFVWALVVLLQTPLYRINADEVVYVGMLVLVDERLAGSHARLRGL